MLIMMISDFHTKTGIPPSFSFEGGYPSFSEIQSIEIRFLLHWIIQRKHMKAGEKEVISILA